jgi:hypothetical protein
MKKKVCIAVTVCALAVAGMWLLNGPQALAGRGDGPVIYVTGQGLFYDSIVTATSLPPKGPFQKLEMAGPSGLQTEFGPGDPEYVGGRWWVDVDGGGEMDEGDDYFSCPLLPPGREEP